MLIAIMQGRLVPPTDGRIQCFPREHWRDEFGLAAEAGLDAIEWIYDLHGADVNPIATDDGVAEMAALSQESNVQVRSVCADWFMDRPLVRAADDELEERSQKLAWLLERVAMLGVQRLVLPFVDASRIDTDGELDGVVRVLEQMLPAAERVGVELHLETSLAPDQFALLLDRLPGALVKVNYDSGNSASLGYHPTDEFAAYGDRVGSVHIKDRVLGGSTVPLGMGNADFDALFACLSEIDYRGDFVLQVARNDPGGEVQWASSNRQFVVERLAGIA